MVRATKKCKVCGKEYEYCSTQTKDSRFRWQDVACCPEHGAEYLRQVQEARAKARLIDIDEPKPSASEAASVEAPGVVDHEEDATDKKSFFSSFINADDEEDDDVDELFDDEEDDAGAVG